MSHLITKIQGKVNTNQRNQGKASGDQIRRYRTSCDPQTGMKLNSKITGTYDTPLRSKWPKVKESKEKQKIKSNCVRKKIQYSTNMKIISYFTIFNQNTIIA